MTCIKAPLVCGLAIRITGPLNGLRWHFWMLKRILLCIHYFFLNIAITLSFGITVSRDCWLMRKMPFFENAFRNINSIILQFIHLSYTSSNIWNEKTKINFYWRLRAACRKPWKTTCLSTFFNCWFFPFFIKYHRQPQLICG